MLKTAAIAALATTAVVVGTSGAAGPDGGTAKKATTYDYTLIATHPFFVDNGEPDPSSGDMFGSRGRIESKGEKAGKFASSCVAVLPVGRCGATLILKGLGRVELSGLFHFSEPRKSVVSVVGGTRAFRSAHGAATLTPESKGEIQQLELKIVE